MRFGKIGARTLMATKWVNPYVTDGLVAMWDGEWNVEGGIHDPNATVWKDLVGIRDFKLVRGVSFGENYLNVNGGYAQWAGPLLTRLFTLEIIFVGSWVSPYNSVFTTSGDEFSLFTAGSRWQWKSISQPNRPTLSSSIYKPLVIVLKETSISLQYQDDTDKNTTQLSSGFPISYTYDRTWSIGGRDVDHLFKGKIYAIRLYSRALTADEIAANYAVDKLRFNLP